VGLKFSLFENGSIKRIEQGNIQINLINGSPLEPGCFNIYLRKKGNTITAIPLLGLKSSGKHILDDNIYETKGEYEGISYSCRLLPGRNDSSWLWSVKLTNMTNKPVELDLISVQDVGLSCADGDDKNNYYISQYIDYKPLWHDKYGYIVCCRKNEYGGGHFPWLALGTISKASSFSTDGMQFYGPAYRQSAVPQSLMTPDLSGLRQGEFGIVSLQAEPFVLESGQNSDFGFFGIYVSNHPAATTQQDLELIEPTIQKLKDLSMATWLQGSAYIKPTTGLFSQSETFMSEELTEDELNVLFGQQRRHCEIHDGRMLSFFYGDNYHVVLQNKELLTQRPCAHILKTGSRFNSDEAIVSCSCHMYGAFLSHLAQGNVNFNRLVAVNTDALNIFRHKGLRIFIKEAQRYYQLTVPSAFEMSPDQCRWIYKHGQILFEVICSADPISHGIRLELNMIKGSNVEWLITTSLTEEHNWQIAANEHDSSLKLLPREKSSLSELYPDGYFEINFDQPGCIEQIGGDEMLFDDGRGRGLDFVVIKLGRTGKFAMHIDGRLTSQSRIDKKLLPKNENVLTNLNLPSVQDRFQVSRISEILPWFIHNAQIHYLTPRGLEQHGGAAWGTRDICQGPIEMLLAMGHYQEVRKILAIVFANQNMDGNWPQWWMFDRYSGIRASESHGDVVLWPLIALGQYIRYSMDFDFLKEDLPYYSETDVASPQFQAVIAHVKRAVEHLTATRFAGRTKLVNYSDGDWNDAMQPVNNTLKKRLISSWTVMLSFQAFANLAILMRKAGQCEMAEQFEILCQSIKEDFNRFLVKDGVVAGFGLTGSEDKISLLLHPSDNTTGIHYCLLPMTRGILSGIFTPQQAKLHLYIVEQHLKVPGGASLMDKPMKYSGGVRNTFKRAESSAFFGREIGLMYTHSHLRYAQALARMGEADAFVKALNQVVPIDIREVVAQADIRQANCYYTSSDADFGNRHEADEHYDDLLAGRIAVNGGWRIYSSGPGIFVGIVISHLLGLRRNYGSTIIDPVMPAQFNGLAADISLFGKNVKLSYSVGQEGGCVSKVEINGKECGFDREDNPYRVGGAIIGDSVLIDRLDRKLNTITIYM
jgi:cellobiose phosphorylase